MSGRNSDDLYLSLHKGPLYKDTFTHKGNSIKITSSNKDVCTPGYRDALKEEYKGPDKDSRTAAKYDYRSLRNILRDEMDKPITIKQAAVIGDALTDLFEALYFDEQ